MNMTTVNTPGLARNLFERLRKHWPVAAVFLFCLAVALAVTIAMERSAYRALVEHATSDAIDYERQFQQGLDSYVHFGRNVAALIEHDHDLDAKSFNRYGQAVNMLDAYPGLSRAGYVAHSGKDDDRYQLRMVYPGGDTARKVLDDDFSAVPARWEAMQRARDSGRPVVTAKHKAISGPASRQSVSLLVPVYNQDLPATTIEQRRSAILGFVFLKFDIEDVIERVMGPQFKDLFDLEIYDGALQRETIVYDGDRTPWSLSATPYLSSVYQKKVMMADRAWNLVFFPKPRYFERYQRNSSQLLLLVGLCVGAFAAFLTAKSRRRQGLRAAQIEQGHRFEAIFENHPSAVFSLDPQRRVVNANANALATFALNKEELLGAPVDNLILPENIARFRERFEDVLNGNSITYESALLNRVGKRIEIAVIMIPVTSNGVLTSVLGLIQNVTQRKQAEWQLQASRNMLQLVIDHIPQRVFWKNTELVFIGCNDAFCQDAGVDDAQQVLGKSDQEMAWAANADLYRRDDLEVMRSGVPRINYEEKQQRPDGEGWLRTSKVPISDQDGVIVGILGVYEDITERKAMERKLEQLAHYDSLTGVANRAFFHGHVEQAVLRSRRHDSLAALIYLDLDKFKSINDTYGHAVGDELLVQFARRIEAAVREMDVVGRLGGDEFALLLEDVADEEAPLRVADKIVEGMRSEFHIGSHVLRLGASIGVAILTPGMTVQALIAKADEAMYEAKRGGRNRFAVAS
jgi:diguanylate cyclase (GGDEF)-like protein/PAS domain S-box-containing protein